MEIALSGIAIVLSLVSLAWQAFQWSRNGPRPHPRGELRITDDDPPVLQITVVNKGRAACELVSIGLRSAADSRMSWGLTNYVHDRSASLPAELKPAHSFVADIDAARLAAAMQGHGALDHSWHIEIKLGDGTTRRSRGVVRMVRALDPNHPQVIEHRPHRTRVLSTERLRRRKR